MRMVKRRELMPDGRRYIVYFTFEENGRKKRRAENEHTPFPSQEEVGVNENVSRSLPLNSQRSEVGSDV